VGQKKGRSRTTIAAERVVFLPTLPGPQRQLPFFYSSPIADTRRMSMDCHHGVPCRTPSPKGVSYFRSPQANAGLALA
jgi:hypothetical protein